MPVGASKLGVLGAGLVPGGSVTFNTSGNWTVPPGVKKVSITGRGGTGNPGNAGNPGNSGQPGTGGAGAGSNGNGLNPPAQPYNPAAFLGWRGGGYWTGINPPANPGSSPSVPELFLPGPPAFNPGNSGSLFLNYVRGGRTGGHPALCPTGSQRYNPTSRCAESGSSGASGQSGSAGQAGQAGNPGQSSSALGNTFPGGAGGNAGAAGNTGTGGSGGGGGGAGGYVPKSGGSGGSGGGGAGAPSRCNPVPCVNPGNRAGGGGGGAGVTNDGANGYAGGVGQPIGNNSFGGNTSGFGFPAPGVFLGSPIPTDMSGGMGTGQDGVANQVFAYALGGNRGNVGQWQAIRCNGGRSNSIFRTGAGGAFGLICNPVLANGFFPNQINFTDSNWSIGTGGGGGGGRGNAGNAGGTGGAGGTGAAGTPTTFNCVTVTPGSTTPITVASPGGQVVISWNPQ